MDEDICGPSITHLQGKKIRHNIHHVETIMVTNVYKGTFDKYKEITLCWDLMHNNGIGFLNTLTWHIMFDTGIMIKIENKEHWRCN